MRMDMHCHIAAEIVNDLGKLDTEVYRSAINDELILNIGTESMKKDLVDKYKIGTQGGKVSGKNFIDLLYRQLKESKKIDAVVLLALDGIYSPADKKRPDMKSKRPGMNPDEFKNKFYEAGTELIVSNRLVYNTVRSLNERLISEKITNKKFYWGASVNPNRDAVSLKNELDFLEKLPDNKPVLMKWIPSYHHIDLDNPVNRGFYQWLVDHRIPLLCHVGPEFAYSESFKPFNQKRDHYSLLKYPLDVGVNVIAPHCVSPFFVTDANEVDAFLKFLTKWNKGHSNKLWVDNSGTSNPTTFLGAKNSLMFPRISRMREFAKKFPREFMLYGTDFPVPVADDHSFSKVPNTTKEQERKLGGFPWPHVSEEFYRELVAESARANFFDMDVAIKLHYGYNEDMFTNAANVLRL